MALSLRTLQPRLYARSVPARSNVPVRARSKRPCSSSDDMAAITAAAQEVNGTFCCGGDLQPKSPIKLLCYDEEAVGRSEALLLSVPASDADIPDLLSLCQEASFGRGSESVLDPSYRSALSLSPTSFSTTFSLEQYGILGTIKTLMMPNTNGTVTAELYKLNVYRPGDFFKSHVDTPRGSGMFGSLVVCLPQAHKGGQLKLQKPPAREQEQQGQQQQGGHEFDWGVNSSKGTVQWAAFYSDCPHEILPVESGYRITLTYNLSLAPVSEAEPALPGLSANSMALHAALKRALANPDFMPEGGTLGFACQHTYPHTQEGLCGSIPSMLKGGDAALLAAAHALGLETEVMAVHDTKRDDGYDYEEDDLGMMVSSLAPASVNDRWEHEYRGADVVSSLFDDSTDTSHITWCLLPSRWALQQVTLAYGNDYSLQGWYSAAAILVDVPERWLRK